jgi:DNA topoisomerase-3
MDGVAAEGPAPRHAAPPASADAGLPVLRPAGPTGGRAAPTERMLSFARSLSRRLGIALPPGVERDFDACRRFLDAHAGAAGGQAGTGGRGSRPGPDAG